MNDQTNNRGPLRPNGLQKGDTIGLFAPAGPIPNEEILQKGEEILRKIGFKVKYDQDICRSRHYLAGSDQQRLKEFKNLWNDPKVKALLAVRGGYGSVRLLSDLDFDEIRKNPKIIIGFSDLTALLNGLQAQTSLVSLHGPMLSTIVRDGITAAECLFKGITGEGIKDIKPKGIKVLRAGTRSGRLMGGNLTTLIHLLGTPYEPDWQGTILFIEDIAEPAYKIDRMLTQLHLSKRLDKVAGIILGDFLDSGNTRIDHFELVEEMILRLTDRSIPVWSNFPVSHGPNNILIPLGSEATMDSNNKILTIDKRYLD